MTSRYANKFKRCPNCRINPSLCFCQELVLNDNQTPVVIVMHRAELELTTNTAYFADKLLKNSVIRVRGFKDEPLDLVNHVDTENYTPLYLFPDEEAKTLDPSFLDTLEKPPLLIVPDGSWRQAKKMKKRESFLGGLQSVVLPTGEESSYRLRTAPAPGAVCTFEAIARALGVCEGSELQKSLESVFKLITDRMYYSRAGLSDLADLPKFLETKKASNEASNEKE